MSGLSPLCIPREATRWLCQTAKIASMSAVRRRWTAIEQSEGHYASSPRHCWIEPHHPRRQAARLPEVAKLLDGLLLDGIKWLTKADQSRKGELHMMEKLLYLLFHPIGSTFTELCKQVQESIQLLLPFSPSNNPLIF